MIRGGSHRAGVKSAAGQALDESKELVDIKRLREVRRCAHFTGNVRQLVRESAHEHDPGCKPKRRKFARYAQAIQFRHPQVKKNDCGVELGRDSDCFAAIIRHGHTVAFRRKAPP